jgi:DNA-binding LytR/AlgR family response regulator
MAAARLEQAMRGCAADVVVVARLTAVRETVHWLRAQGSPDLMFLDIRLSDGLSLEIFDACKITCPIIFTTAYDDYLLEAFTANGIEYLLKPVEAARLARAIEKYRQLKTHFLRLGAPDMSRLCESAAGIATKRRRFLVRKGAEFISVSIDRVAYFYSEHKLTFLVDRDGQRFLLDDSLTEVEGQVDADIFFRANRQFLVSVGAIGRFRPGGKGQIEVDLLQGPNRLVTISQERAGEFRRWIDR